MHSISLIAAALAAVAVATPIASSSPSSSSTTTAAATTTPAVAQLNGAATSTTASTGASTTASTKANQASPAPASVPSSGSAPAPAAAAPKVLGVPGRAPNPVPSAGTVGTLRALGTEVDMYKEIQKEVDAKNIALIFDFNPSANPAVKSGPAGEVVLANLDNFPTLVNTGVAAAAIFFDACGLNTPHTHPRATELLTLVTDNTMTTGFVLENGLPTEFNTTLKQYQATVFPQGAFHWQQNMDCTPAVAMAALNNEDPGASSIAQNLLNLNPDVLNATAGFPKEINAANFATFKNSIPPSLAKGVEECLIRCNIPY